MKNWATGRRTEGKIRSFAEDIKMFLVYYDTSISGYYESFSAPILTYNGIYIDPFVIFLQPISDETLGIYSTHDPQ